LLRFEVRPRSPRSRRVALAVRWIALGR